MSAKPSSEKITTFTGNTFDEAKEKVRAAFGDDAMLVDIRQPKKAFHLGAKAESLVEIDALPAPPPPPKPGGNTLLAKVYGATNPAKTAVAAGVPALATVAAKYEEKNPAALVANGLTFANPEPVTAAYETPAARPLENPPPAMSPEILVQMQQMIQTTLERNFNHLGSIMVGGNAPIVGERYFEIYRRLIEGEVDAAIAKEIAEKMHFNLGVSPQLTDALVTETLTRMLSGEFVTAPNLAETPPPAGQPQVIALIGPSGSGKTTTAVKLAFDAAVTHQRNVALITEDLHRPGAEAQLRSMISLLGFPIVGADTPAKIAEEIQNFAMLQVRMVIIDTAGRATRDHQGLDELAKNLTAAAPNETHLVIPATMAEKAALGYAESYRACNYNRLLVSKIDEAVNFGLLLNLARRLPVPFSALATSGQSFRNGLTFATAEMLARLIVHNRYA